MSSVGHSGPAGPPGVVGATGCIGVTGPTGPVTKGLEPDPSRIWGYYEPCDGSHFHTVYRTEAEVARWQRHVMWDTESKLYPNDWEAVRDYVAVNWAFEVKGEF